MKNILLLLSVFLMSLLGYKGIESTLLPEGGVGMNPVLQTEMSIGNILPVETESSVECDAYVDMESLARQYRGFGRGYRTFSVQQMFWGKSSAYRAAKKRLEMLLHTINHVYTSLPCQSWPVASDHYIFGLRRILI